MLLIVKKFVAWSFAQTPYFKRLVLRWNSQLYFPLKQQLKYVNLLLRMAKRTKEKFVFLTTLDSFITCTLSFDLWMSQGVVDTFVFIVHFSNDKWEPYHLIIRFYEITTASSNAMPLQVNDLFTKHGFNFVLLHIIFPPWFKSLKFLLCFEVVGTFCRNLLGLCNFQVLPICHKWLKVQC